MTEPRKTVQTGNHAWRNITASIVMVASITFSVPALAEQEHTFAPENLDLAKLIECRARVPDYNELASWLLTEPKALDLLDWHRTNSGNPFIEQYRLNKPVSVFGVEVRDIAFASSALLAIIDDANASDLANRLKVSALIESPDKFMGERIISEEIDDTNELITLKTRVILNVSTVESHPGKILVGCSYSFNLDVRD